MDASAPPVSQPNDDSVLPSVFDCAKRHLAERRPIVLGISPGNPYYYREENLRKLLQFANEHSDKVKLFITDVIGEHNYRAVGSSNPERASRVKGNRLRNKVKSLLKVNPSLCPSELSYVEWRKDVETCSEYTQKLDYIMKLFNTHAQFRQEVMEVTNTALQSLCEGRRGGAKENRPVGSEHIVSSDADKKTFPLNKNDENSNHKDNRERQALGGENNKEGHSVNGLGVNNDYDVIEGSNYLLKELAFFLSIPSIYGGFDRFVFVYHRPWPILENLFNGVYDGEVVEALGFVILE